MGSSDPHRCCIGFFYNLVSPSLAGANVRRHLNDIDFGEDVDQSQILKVLENVPQIKDPVRRRIILDEAYYEIYQLMTAKEAQHPFNQVLALESEDWYTHSLLKSRIERFFELEIGSYGVGLEELFKLPRFYVDEIFRVVTDLKAKKTRRMSGLTDNLEDDLAKFLGKQK